MQGLPPGHTAPCYPVSIPGIRQHRVLNAAKDSDADAAARARFALLGNAVTVQVGLLWFGVSLVCVLPWHWLAFTVSYTCSCCVHWRCWLLVAASVAAAGSVGCSAASVGPR